MKRSFRRAKLAAFGAAAQGAVFLVLVAAGAGRAADVLVPLESRQVKLGGQIGRRIDLTVQGNLLKLDIDKEFLKPFQDRNSQGGFIGLGMLIDAAVRLAAYTGDPKVLALKRHLVGETIKTQAADGYIGMMVPASRMWRLWDLSEMAYIVYGLTSDFRLFQEKDSLAAARKLADYIIARWTAEPDGDPTEGSITLEMACVGLERALLSLSEATGDGRYLDFCLEKRRLRQWDMPITVGRWGRIEGHAYAYLAACLAQLQWYRTEPEARLLGPTRRAMDFLTRGDGLVVIGTCGDHECWHDTQAGTINLGETCATAYLLRVLDDLLRLEGDSQWGDIMERTIYNALFAAQSPDGRRIRYYTPFDGPRSYFPGDSYCCPNNFRRIVAELPGMVYYRAGDGLAVNLYTASSARLKLEEGLWLSVRQETDYPSSGKVTIHLEPSDPVEVPLLLRIPRWCSEARVLINGKPVQKPAPGGSFLTLQQTWKRGDRVQLEMPMPWRLVKGRKAQAGRVAILRGPVVYCLNPQRNKDLGPIDLRLLTIKPESLEGPIPDAAVRPGGLACKIRAWGPGAWYPLAPADKELVLTEFADPGGQATYFHVPNPNAQQFVEDELMLTQ
ncbi:MAG: beta-L-arabinofuranosidase domain-containing protein [Thermoguttaceae bacterium]